ncbi:MAG: FG-GAP-like repeat-containing protein [Ignavibacteria bacterium]
MKNQYLIFAIIIVSIFSSSMIYSTPINQYINTVSPSQNAVSVIKSSNITIVFTQDMNPATINNANIKVFGYQTGLLPVTIDYNAAGKTANINPNQDLKAGEKISLTLTSGIKTISNESITPFVYSFIIKTINGTGNFVLYSEIFHQSDYIRSGDVDSDGDIDLLISDKIYKNNGTAVFSYYSSIPIIGYPLMADFDNDGDLDILVSENNTNHFFSNNGLGDFVQTYSFPGGLHSLGDLDGNGFLDITYFSPFSALEINVSKNLSGIFTFDNSYNVNFNLPCGPSSGFDHKILIDDMNNNGKLDLVLINGNAGGGSILGYQFCQIYTLLKNNGDANYISELLFTHDANNLPYWVINTGDPQLFDNNNDGLIDINSPGLILRNNGNNLFSVSGNLNTFSTIIPGDFNGDSKLDILAQILEFHLYLHI